MNTPVIKLKRTVRSIPGVSNRVIYTNEVNGDVLGQIEFEMCDPQIGIAMMEDTLGFMKSQFGAVSTAPASALAALDRTRRHG